MKYILTLVDSDPENDMTIHCDSESEKEKYHKRALDQGYAVKVEERK